MKHPVVKVARGDYGRIVLFRLEAQPSADNFHEQYATDADASFFLTHDEAKDLIAQLQKVCNG